MDLLLSSQPNEDSQLGFMAPDGNTNLAVKDVINALSFLQTVAPSFGGHPSKITISGQSSGANMVRALLAVPSASSKFKSAIMHSDPMVSSNLYSCMKRLTVSHRTTDSYLPLHKLLCKHISTLLFPAASRPAGTRSLSSRF